MKSKSSASQLTGGDFVSMLDLRNPASAHQPVSVGSKVTTAVRKSQNTYTLPRKKLQRVPSFESLKSNQNARRNDPVSYKAYSTGPVRRAPPPPSHTARGTMKPGRKAPDPPSHRHPSQQLPASCSHPLQAQQDNNDNIYEAPGASLPPYLYQASSDNSNSIIPSRKAPPPPPPAPNSAKPPVSLPINQLSSHPPPVLPLQPSNKSLSLLIHMQRPTLKEDEAEAKEELYECPEIPPFMTSSCSNLLATRELPPVPQLSAAGEQKQNLDDVYESAETCQTACQNTISFDDKPPPVPDKPRPFLKEPCNELENQTAVDFFQPPPISSSADNTYTTSDEGIYEEADTSLSGRRPTLPTNPSSCLSPPSRPPPPPPLSRIPASKPPALSPARSVPPPIPLRTSSVFMSVRAADETSLTKEEGSTSNDACSVAESNCSINEKNDSSQVVECSSKTMACDGKVVEEDTYMDMASPQNHLKLLQKKLSELRIVGKIGNENDSEDLYTEMSPSPLLQYRQSWKSLRMHHTPPKIAPKPNRGLKPVLNPSAQPTEKKLAVSQPSLEQPSPIPSYSSYQEQQHQTIKQPEPLEANDGDLYEPVGECSH